MKGISELGKGNELIVLRCLKKATADENMRVPWARYEERLIEFLEQISKLPNDYENVEDILNEAVEVADLYGRLQRLHPRPEDGAKYYHWRGQWLEGRMKYLEFRMETATGFYTETI